MAKSEMLVSTSVDRSGPEVDLISEPPGTAQTEGGVT
jgi:hypothetical protein